MKVFLCLFLGSFLGGIVGAWSLLAYEKWASNDHTYKALGKPLPYVKEEPVPIPRITGKADKVEPVPIPKVKASNEEPQGTIIKIK